MDTLRPGDERLLGPWTNVSLTGRFLPFHGVFGPVMINMPDSDQTWVPVYSTVDKLDESCAELGVAGYSVKVIDDGVEFLTSLLDAGVRVMLDPYLVRSENKTRWTEVRLPS